MTVRKALNNLKDDGVIESKQGSGWYVKNKASRINHNSYSEPIITPEIIVTSVDVLQFETSKSTQAESLKLEIQTSDLVHRVTIKYRDDKNNSFLRQCYVAYYLFPDYNQYDAQFDLASLYLQRYHNDIARIEYTIYPFISDLKAQNLEENKLIIEKIHFIKSNKALFYTVDYYDATQTSVVFQCKKTDETRTSHWF